MRFPVNVTSQKRCPVCKAEVSTDPYDPDPPPSAGLSLSTLTEQRGEGDKHLGCLVTVDWDSGVCKSARSRTTLGAVVTMAKRDGGDPSEGGGLEVRFCSTRCLRQFLMAAVDDLERRVAAVEPEARAARAKGMNAE